MKHKKWWIGLSVASVLVLFCVVRAIWRPAASDAADRSVGAGRMQANANAMDARLKKTLESMDAKNTMAADEATLKQLEEAKEAQLKQQQAAKKEAPVTQEEPPEASWENPGLSIEAVFGAANGFCAVIGGKVVREGDVVNGYRMVKIRADQVELSKDGRVFIQKMN